MNLSVVQIDEHIDALLKDFHMQQLQIRDINHKIRIAMQERGKASAREILGATAEALLEANPTLAVTSFPVNRLDN